MWVRALVDCEASAGGKAAGLARLLRAGLPVPDGFAIDAAALDAVVGEVDEPALDDAQLLHQMLHPASALDDAGHRLETIAQRIEHAALPEALVAEVDAALARLPGPTFAVRSSSALEDRATGAAPGVFASFVDVPRAEIWRAIRGVWASAVAPLAASYTHDARPAIDVIVQRFVPGERVTIYTRPAGEPARDEVWIQRGGALIKHARASDDPIVTLALAAETVIGAHTGADVELVDDAGTRWVVQARPIVHPVPRTRTPPPPLVLAPLQDGRVWHWDVAHNPDPLSVAQAGLVERVERAQVAPWTMRVCGGYLYTAERLAMELPEIADVAELDARARAIQLRLLASLGLDPVAEPAPVSLAIAIERYVAFYAIWAGELVPLIRAGRRALAPEDVHGARPSAIEHVLLAAARGDIDERRALLQLGALSPAWDVAVPTFAEQPGRIRAAIARARVAIGRIPSGAKAVREDRQTDLARAAADLAERDDQMYALAQALVRHALGARARELAIDREDIFWLPLEEVATATAIDRDEAHRRASAARSAAARAADWEMPLVVGAAPRPAGPPLVGVGTGPRVTGRVVRLASLGAVIAVGHGDVIVTRAITPALAVIVMGCAAIVSETGGLLDHGAAMAREFGIPCVVGCRDAWSLLYDGMVVTVDGDAGTVTR